MRMSVLKGIVGVFVLLLFGMPMVMAADGLGYIGILIQDTNQISVYTNGSSTTDTMAFVDSQIPAAGLSLNSNIASNMTGGETGFVIENQGNIKVRINVTSDKNAAAFIGGTAATPLFEYWAGNNETSACAGGDLASTTSFVTATGGSSVCGGAGLDFVASADQINCYIHIFIPSDATPEAKSATLTFTSTAAV